nr:MAK10-like protein [Tanacetum cinerariifolium]
MSRVHPSAASSSSRIKTNDLVPTQPTQVNRITTPCEICSGPYDTQYCMEDPEQAFVEYASSHTNKARGSLKRINALVNQGSNTNIMPLSTYMKLTDKRPAETDIRLSLASHSVYDIDIMEDEKRPFILGTSFLMTAKAVIKFDKGTITLRSRKSKISFRRIPESLGKVEKGIKNDIEPIAPTMTVNRLVLE